MRKKRKFFLVLEEEEGKGTDCETRGQTLNSKLLPSRALPRFNPQLWNGMSTELKQCPNMIQFKRRFKSMIFIRYRDEGVN